MVRHPVPSVGRVWSVHENHPLDLVSPGFIKSHKGYYELLDLLSSKSKVTWNLAGSPQDAYDKAFTTRLETRIEELGLTARVRITGYLSRCDLEEHAVRAKAAIFPFHQAVGSGSLTWAIGMGMPVLATNLPALAQFREAGAGIKLLPLDRRETWPDLIDSVLGDPAEQEALSRANLDYARTNSYAELARQTAHIFRCLAEGRKAI
jgi:glycosyltransferase involved in cell wall biosynthesis